MTIIGIDYSLTCPCVCVSNNKVFADNYFYFLHDNKKYAGQVLNINGDEHDDYLVDQQRYENIASWVLSIIAPLDREKTQIIIEDYSFGSKGKVFHLAENCGIMKYLLYKDGWRFATVAPTVVKKYATGKGNANKQAMYDAFYENTEIDLIDIFGGKNRRLDSPVTDIVDSFYLACYMRDSLATRDTGKLNRGTNRNQSRRVDPKL